ncbi:MAG TPA: GGDEF domain-containing protein [Rhizomicrobium sp.]|nr:GGDEF domain-containing protein [Rhizomicrobium sp.]
MIRRVAVAFALAVAFLAGAVVADMPSEVNFGAASGVIELKPLLKPYVPPAVARPDSSNWYVFSALNTSERAATRVLQAGQPPYVGFSIIPRPLRPTIEQVASTNPGVVIESSNAYGRKGYRITIPATARVSVAVRVAGAEAPPSLLAWTEPALAAHNREVAIYVAAVAGLIAAAAVILGAFSVMTHHAAPRWAAAALASVLLTRLSSIGMFDGSIVTSIGGPYGLTAMFGGLALAACIRFVDEVMPFREVWPPAARWLDRTVLTLIGVSILAYVGLPGATLLTDILLLVGPLALFAYLAWRRRLGAKRARMLMPAAGLFSVVSLIVAFSALGVFGRASLTPDLAGGFAAAGSIMLALAVTAGEGIAVNPFGRHSLVHFAPAPARGAAPAAAPPAAPVPKAAAPATLDSALEAIGASRQGVFELDLKDDVLFLSADAAALLGMAEQKLAHRAWIVRVHRDDREVYEQAISEFRAQSGLAFRIEFRVRAEDGRYPWFELRATMKGTEGAAAERCVGLLADVTTRKEAEAEMMDRTLRDPLTGLGNRVALMEELENLGEKLHGAAFAVLDIDRFKSIHASLGDAGGDDILTRVAERLTKHFRGIAQVFRIGGDGFAALVRSPAKSAAEIGADLVKTCGAAYQIEDRSVFAPVSVGVALGSDARDPLDLLKNAELALTQAKRHGGDCARVYSPEMEAFAPRDAVALEAELHRALDGGEIEVFYQPIVRLSDRTVAGFEALLRWRHPAKGLVEPGEFIAHSEETGLIVSLGHLALMRAARDLAQWQRYFPLAEPLFVSVNLSRRQLRDPELLNCLSNLLAGAGLAPGTLMLEITESAIASEADARALAARIRSLGAGLAIDDFGTGLSSLSQLADLPFDTVKIDKSFLARHGGTDTEANGDVVLASIVSLAHELKRSVIVEGVETETDAAKVAELGCEYAQGFHFSEPVTAVDAMTYIARTFRAPESAASGASGVGRQA